MKEYKTKHSGYKIETVELESGQVDVHVGKSHFFKTTWATTTTKTFENHTQAVSYAKNAIDSGEIDTVFRRKNS